jgi:hypothetical protein
MTNKTPEVLIKESNMQPIMHMNINAWKSIISFVELEKYPLLPCPYCLETALEIDESSIQKRPIAEKILEQSSRKFKTAKATKKAVFDKQIETLRNGEGFWLKMFASLGLAYQDMIDPLNGKQYQFNCFFSCNKCCESTNATGVLLEPLKLSEQSIVKPSIIKIEHFSPTIPMIPLSINIPDNIKVELIDAFKHFHFDTLSSASKLRRAIEQFCINMEAKGHDLNQRICNLKQRYPEEAEYLEALKLIGNEGTHSHNVTEIDLLHAFEIVQFVLEVYDRKARYHATQVNYELLANKFGKDKSGKDNMQLRLEKPLNDKEIASV